MFCHICNRMLYACTCKNKTQAMPPSSPMMHPQHGNIGTINNLGTINAPGQPFHGMKADPMGRIPGTNFVMEPGGLMKDLGHKI